MSMNTDTVTTLTLTCDGPKCTGKDGKGRTTLVWIDEEIKKDPLKIPDDLVRFFAMKTPLGAEVNFCSPRCVTDALKEYVPPLSPREQAEKDKQNAAVEAAKNPAPEVPIDPVAAVGGISTEPEAPQGIYLVRKPDNPEEQA